MNDSQKNLGKVEDVKKEHQFLMENIFRLPHKILQNYYVDALPQMTLHELGHKDCFDLKRAVYLVDNPDFDHLMGVAGFSKGECKYHKNNIWQEPCKFCDDMKPANFNNDVRKFLKQSLKRKDIDLNNADDVKELGRGLGLEDPHYFAWNMKHGNHGILIFDEDQTLCPWGRNLLVSAAALLSLCGI